MRRGQPVTPPPPPAPPPRGEGARAQGSGCESTLPRAAAVPPPGTHKIVPAAVVRTQHVEGDAGVGVEIHPALGLLGGDELEGRVGTPFLRNVSQLLEIHPGPPRPLLPQPPHAPPASRSLRRPPSSPRARSSRAGSARLCGLSGRRRGRATRVPFSPGAPPGGDCLHAVCNWVGGDQGQRGAAPGSSPLRLSARPLSGSHRGWRGGRARLAVGATGRDPARREGPGAPRPPLFHHLPRPF